MELHPKLPDGPGLVGQGASLALIGRVVPGADD